MPLYLVSYDIAEQHGDEYKPLWDYLERLGSLKVLYSEHATPFEKTALDLANEVHALLKRGDHLLVSELFRNGNPNPIAFAGLLVDRQKFSDLVNRYARSLS